MKLVKFLGPCARLFAAAALLTLAGCSSERNFRAIPPGEGPPVPHSVHLREPLAISTVHFPVGTYSLIAEDNGGYYYNAPRQVTKHAFAGLQQYEGGIYVRKGSRRAVRGYLVWAGGRTKIGNLAQADYSFAE